MVKNIIIFARDYLFAALINKAILAIKLYLREAFIEITNSSIFARDYLFAALINNPPTYNRALHKRGLH